MTKFLIVLFKLVIPIAFLAWPIIDSFETGLEYALGTSGLILGFILIRKLFKWFDDIKWKEKQERIGGAEPQRKTLVKFEIARALKYGSFFAIINLIALFIEDINTLAFPIIASYIIGAFISISAIEN